jgi:hypothetical protein
MPFDRRTFLRRATGALLAAPLAGEWACRPAPPAADDGAGTPPTVPEGQPIIRPVLLAAAPDAVRLVDPPRDRPVAYLSRAELRVYVDPDLRDVAERHLGAYISVTTGAWRVPLLEDDPRVPVTPGDQQREFEEVDLREWDPRMSPAEGDACVRVRDVARVRVECQCEPVLQDETWVSGGPYLIHRLNGPAGQGGREEFRVIGLGSRHRDRACQDGGEPVRLLGWATDP